MIIIGISGKKQSGKSTFVDYLYKKVPNSKVIRFADNLKQIVLDCFVPPMWGWDRIEEFETDANKNRTLPCGKTVRQVLQLVGTDWFRNTWEECWINTYKKNLLRLQKHKSRRNPSVVFTPDVRFPNELRTIQEMGGYVIRLLRAPFADQDQHESEIALDEVEAKTSRTVRVDYKDFGRNISDVWKRTLPEFMEKDDHYVGLCSLARQYPGKFFDIIFDNREKTLEETCGWVDDHFINCFSWEGDSEFITRMSFDPTKINIKR